MRVLLIALASLLYIVAITELICAYLLVGMATFEGSERTYTNGAQAMKFLTFMGSNHVLVAAVCLGAGTIVLGLEHVAGEIAGKAK
jgi:hypothetical protein